MHKRDRPSLTLAVIAVDALHREAFRPSLAALEGFQFEQLCIECSAPPQVF